jgi:hypothetical protein
MEANVSSLLAAFPRKPAFQYINLLNGATDQTAALSALATWSLSHPHAGIGCPDVATVASFQPAGYDILKSATFQGRLPFNVAVQNNDYLASRTSGLDGTFAVATGAAPSGMAAQMVVWQYTADASNVFTLQEVAAYLSAHADPNIAPPSY